jgi:hypothetical protein
MALPIVVAVLRLLLLPVLLVLFVKHLAVDPSSAATEDIASSDH